MASIRKRDGKFQAQVRRGGVFKSATFFKKSELSFLLEWPLQHIFSWITCQKELLRQTGSGYPFTQS